MNTYISGLFGGVIGLILGLVISPMLQTNSVPEVANASDERFDKHFIEEMIPHHEGAVAMAELALEHGVRPEMTAFAQAVIREQSREIDEMNAWYQEWFGVAVPSSAHQGHGGHGMHMMGMEGDLVALMEADDFDLEFVRQMIPHHEMAIMMTQMLLAGTDRPELQSLGNDIIASQSDEIRMMRQWAEEWSN